MVFSTLSVMLPNIGKLVRGKEVGNKASDSINSKDSKEKAEDTNHDGWVTRTFGDGNISNLLGHHYRTSTVCISPSGRYVAIIRYRPVYTIRQITKLTLMMNDDTQPDFKNQIFILDLADLSLKRYRVNDGSTLQKINYFCWLADFSIMTVKRTLSSFVQKQYSVDHDTQTLIVLNTYESKVDGLQPVLGDSLWFYRLFQQTDHLRSTVIQGIKFSIVSTQYGDKNQMWLLPYNLNEMGPRHPPIYVRLKVYESGEELKSKADSFYSHGSKIYLQSERRQQQENRVGITVTTPHDLYFCCDLADINITTTEMNFINTGTLYEIPTKGEHSKSVVRSHPARVNQPNTVTIRQSPEKDEVRLWIWNIEDETLKEHSIRTTDDLGICIVYKSLFFALEQTNIFPPKIERNMLKFKILPCGPKSTLADLCRRRILSKPESFAKETDNLKGILFTQ